MARCEEGTRHERNDVSHLNCIRRDEKAVSLSLPASCRRGLFAPTRDRSPTRRCCKLASPRRDTQKAPSHAHFCVLKQLVEEFRAPNSPFEAADRDSRVVLI